MIKVKGLFKSHAHFNLYGYMLNNKYSEKTMLGKYDASIIDFVILFSDDIFLFYAKE